MFIIMLLEIYLGFFDIVRQKVLDLQNLVKISENSSKFQGGVDVTLKMGAWRSGSRE
jgi:hypothetical protein